MPKNPTQNQNPKNRATIQKQTVFAVSNRLCQTVLLGEFGGGPLVLIIFLLRMNDESNNEDYGLRHAFLLSRPLLRRSARRLLYSSLNFRQYGFVSPCGFFDFCGTTTIVVDGASCTRSTTTVATFLPHMRLQALINREKNGHAMTRPFHRGTSGEN